jgi:exosortase
MNDGTGPRIGRNKVALLCLLAAGSLALFWPVIRTLAELAWTHEQYSHILLILPLSFGFAFAEAGHTTEIESKTSPWGLALFLPAAIFAWFASAHTVMLSASSRLSLSILGLVFLWLSFVVFFLGPAVFWHFRLPLLVLFLLVPLPDFVLSRTILALQVSSAQTTYWLFRLAGIPVTQSGFILSLPGLNIEVAEECSGIRSTMMLLVTSFVLGKIFLKPGWQRIVLTLLVVPIAVLKNAVRIFVLATLGLYVNEAWLNGRLHHQGGVVFFIFGTGLVGLTIWVLRRFEFRSSPREGLPLLK